MDKKSWLGTLGEIDLEREFMEHKIHTFSPIKDDGIDFVIQFPFNKESPDTLCGVQVKSVKKGNLNFINEKKVNLTEIFLIAYVVYEKNQKYPKIYIFNSSLLYTEEGKLLYTWDEKYNNFNFKYNSKNIHIWEKYTIDNFFEFYGIKSFLKE